MRTHRAANMGFCERAMNGARRRIKQGCLPAPESIPG